MSDARCIRIFRTESEAEYAKKILKEAGFWSSVTEDGFGTLKLKDLGFRSRFRLYVRQKDIEPIGEYLKSRLNEKQLD